MKAGTWVKEVKKEQQTQPQSNVECSRTVRAGAMPNQGNALGPDLSSLF